MVSLLDRVGLKANSGKIVGMVCRKFQSVGTQSYVAYGRKMTGVGPSFQERQRGWIQCKEYG